MAQSDAQIWEEKKTEPKHNLSDLRSILTGPEKEAGSNFH